MCLSVGPHRRTLSSSILLEQYPASFVSLTWMVCEMGDKWTYRCCFVGYCFQNFFIHHTASLCSSNLAFCQSALLKSRWCSHTIVLTQLQFGWNPILFYQISNFPMVSNLSIAILHFLCTRIFFHHFQWKRYCYWSIWNGLQLTTFAYLC